MMEVSAVADVADKAVATDDLNIDESCESVEEPKVEYFQVARLEAVLTTLLENKFAAIKSLTKKTKPRSRLRKLFSPASQVSSSLPTNQQLTAFDSLQYDNDSDQPCFGKQKSTKEQWKHQRHYDHYHQYRHQHHHHHSHQHHHHHHHRHHRTSNSKSNSSGQHHRSGRTSQHFHHHHHHRRHRSHSNHRSFKRKKYSDSDTEVEASPGRRHARKKGRIHHHRMPSQSSDPEGNGDTRHSPGRQSSFSLTDIEQERYDCDILHYMECDKDGQLFIASPRHLGPTTEYGIAATTTCTCHSSVVTPSSNMLNHNAPCYLMGSSTAQINIHYDEDYLSVNIEEDEDEDMPDDDDGDDVDGIEFVNERETYEPDELIMSSASQTRRKHRSKRRKKHRRKRYDSSGRRRRHHHHHHHHHITMITGDSTDGGDVRPIDPDDLPQRARWTIVATACLLLLMCLLLVGVTLRMAPLIDEMVRKENEELMNTLSRDPMSFNTNHTSQSNQSKLLSSLATQR